MRPAVVLFFSVVVALLATACAPGESVADPAAEAVPSQENVDESVAVQGPSNEEPDGMGAPAGLEGQSCDVPSTVVTSVRDVYAVVEPEVADGYVLIAGDILSEYDHIRFTVVQDGRDYEFFGYMIDGNLRVRAAVCPCCGDDGLSHGGTCLSCHSCGTTFGLEDDYSDDDACGFPAGEVPYEARGNCVAMLLGDLVEAYERTADGETELFEPAPEPVENEADDTSWPRCCRRPS